MTDMLARDQEEIQEHLERLEAMVADDGQTWDLTIHDKKAINWALFHARKAANFGYPVKTTED